MCDNYNALRSPYLGFRYILNMLYSVQMCNTITTIDKTSSFGGFDGKYYYNKLGLTGKINSISIGFHSILKADKYINFYKENFSNGNVLYQGIIPKGALYYIGHKGLIASNQIIITNKL